MQIRELNLQTAVLPELIAFYGKVLEMKIEVSGWNKCTIYTAGSKLVFSASSHEQQPYYHFAFNIPYNKIDEAKQWLEKRTPLLWLDDYNGFIAEFVNWQARSVYFIDPAGNIVELIGRAGLGDISEEPFTPALFRNVSEIGLVFSVEKYDDSISEMLDSNFWQYFEHQPPSKHFRAIGSDEGLLICVPEGRNWYPADDIQAVKFPLSFIVEAKGQWTKFDI